MDRLLVALSELQAEVRATRSEGHDRHEQNRRVQTELRDALTTMGQLVQEHAITLVQRGSILAEVLERLDAHNRLIQALADQGAANSTLLAQHALMIAEMKDALAGVREWAREAKQAASDLAQANAGFQAGVIEHVGSLATTFNDRAEELKSETKKLADNDAAQHAQNVQILQALGVPTEPPKEGNGTGKPVPAGKLDQVRTAGKIAIFTSSMGTVMLILKIIYEVLKSH